MIWGCHFSVWVLPRSSYRAWSLQAKPVRCGEADSRARGGTLILVGVSVDACRSFSRYSSMLISAVYVIPCVIVWFCGLLKAPLCACVSFWLWWGDKHAIYQIGCSFVDLIPSWIVVLVINLYSFTSTKVHRTGPHHIDSSAWRSMTSSCPICRDYRFCCSADRTLFHRVKCCLCSVAARIWRRFLGDKVSFHVCSPLLFNCLTFCFDDPLPELVEGGGGVDAIGFANCINCSLTLLKLCRRISSRENERGRNTGRKRQY